MMISNYVWKIIVGCMQVVVAFMYFSFAYHEEPRHPSDAELIDNFTKNKAEFDSLQSMAVSDCELVRIAPDFLWLRDDFGWPRPESRWGVTRRRWEQYKLSFKDLNIKNGLLRRAAGDSCDDVYYMVSARGNVGGGSEKGYFHSVHLRGLLVDSTDRWQESVSGNGPAFMKIEDGWYVYFIRSN